MSFAEQLSELLTKNLLFCKQLHKDSLEDNIDIDFVTNNIHYEYIAEDGYDVIVKFTNINNEILYVRLCGRYIDKYYGKNFTNWIFTSPKSVTITKYEDYNI